MILRVRRILQSLKTAIMMIALGGTLSACTTEEPEPQLDAEVIVVGAGISGLSAAVEMGRAGVNVLVVDMNSVPGGHAVLAAGFAIVDTPVQEKAGYEDSPERAYEDWMAWSDGGDPQWTRFYAENSREMIHDWAADMGVEWVSVFHIGQENSVPRFHFPDRGGLGVISALMYTALELPNVRFLWNQRVEHLTVDETGITGVEALNLRTGETRTLKAEHVVLATGGFEGNLERVLANWSPHLPKPDRLLIGASTHARGQGLDLATEAGAELSNLDRHFIYTDGTVDIRDAEGKFAITASNRHAIWVNAAGNRFTNEAGLNKVILADLLKQDPATYWTIFDEPAREGFTMRGVEWVKNAADSHPLLDNSAATKKAKTLEELAKLTGLPASALAASVQRYNELVEAGTDTDFARFSKQDEAPPKIKQPPFYAVQFFPMTRKSMGGVAIDMEGRALNHQGDVVPGLYAVGELTGSVGINGEHGMAGMFLGPAVITGRVAGQTISAAYTEEEDRPALLSAAGEDLPLDSDKWDSLALQADDLAELLSLPRDGYWHFQKSHEMVLEQEYQCAKCHSAELPFFPLNNRISKLAQLQVCSNCHGRWQ